MRKVRPNIVDVLIVPGQPHFYLAPEKSKSWKSLRDSYDKVRKEVVEKSGADLILYYSTQWLSIIGHLFQADPNPEWTYVDANWHDYGSIKYSFKIDTEFSKLYCEKTRAFGYNAALVNYHGFPIDVGTIVAQKLLNPDNKIPASIVSCNMYAEKRETTHVGWAAAEAIQKSGKRVLVVLVTGLSNRFEVKDIDPAQDKISSAKDHEWNLKICELLGEGRLEDVDQCSREFARQANADMGFKGIWWLNALCGNSNDFKGKVFDYQPVWGTGAALIRLTPKRDIEVKILDEEPEVDEVADEAQKSHMKKDQERRPSSSTKAQSSKPTQLADSEQVMSQRAPEPVGPYPHARREGEFLFLSGVGPRSRKGTAIPGVTLGKDGQVVAYDAAIQTEAVLENVKTILEDSGSSLEDVVDVQVYLTDIKKDFATFNKVYEKYFKNIRPTRTTIGVTGLPTPIAVELKVVARLES